METKLARKQVTVAGLKALTEEQMMADVRDVLGYGVADEAIQVKKVGEILRSLDIEPFDPKRVAAYKKEVIKETRKNSRRSSYYYDAYRWKNVPISRYTEPVPAFALMRAAQVQKALNAANIPAHFEVEELTKTRARINVDPFMVLVVGRQRLYIDVWNEPKFEGRRTV
jgi:hypothetical protein